jgi:hypothetical protein
VLLSSHHPLIVIDSFSISLYVLVYHQHHHHFFSPFVIRLQVPPFQTRVDALKTAVIAAGADLDRSVLSLSITTSLSLFNAHLTTSGVPSSHPLFKSLAYLTSTV